MLNKVNKLSDCDLRTALINCKSSYSCKMYSSEAAARKVSVADLTRKCRFAQKGAPAQPLAQDASLQPQQGVQKAPTSSYYYYYKDDSQYYYYKDQPKKENGKYYYYKEDAKVNAKVSTAKIVEAVKNLANEKNKGTVDATIKDPKTVTPAPGTQPATQPQRWSRDENGAIEFDVTDEAASSTADYPWLSAAEIQDIRNIFTKNDSNSDGIADSAEVLAFLKSLLLDEEAAQEMLQTMDVGEGLTLEKFTEFFNDIKNDVYNFTHDNQPLEVSNEAFDLAKEYQWLSAAEIQDFLTIFVQHDKDGDGKLDQLDELEDLLKWMKISPEGIAKAKKEMDKDGDGVDKKEFVAYFSESKMRHKMGGEPELIKEKDLVISKNDNESLIQTKNDSKKDTKKDTKKETKKESKKENKKENGKEVNFEVSAEAIAHGATYVWLSAAEIQDIMNLFPKFDVNNDGFADYTETKEYFKMEEFANQMFDYFETGLTETQKDDLELKGLTVENFIDFFNNLNHTIYKLKAH